MAVPGLRVDERMMAALGIIAIAASVPTTGNDLSAIMERLRGAAVLAGCEHPRVSVAIVDPDRAELEVVCADIPGLALPPRPDPGAHDE